MKTNQWFLVGVLSAWLIAATVRGQESSLAPIAPPLPIPGNGDTAPGYSPAAPSSGGMLSDWILYNSNAAAVPRDCCEGPHGSAMPLWTELYLRSGPSIPVGGDTLTRELKVGWTIEGGGRALFFNEPMTRAWTVDVNIVNVYESGGRNNTEFPLVAYNAGVKETFGSNGVPGVLVQSSNRTLVGLALGREWYFWNDANCHGRMWRAGVDVGGRYGSHSLYIVADTGPSHVTDVVTSIYTAAHSDLEFPTRFGIFSVGLRMEWAYTFSDILQQPSNIQDLSFLVNLGLRF
jgi:hypothetical protein